MLNDVRTLLPELLLFVGGLVVLVVGSFSPRTRQWRSRALSAAVLVAAAVVAGVDMVRGAREAFEGTFTADTATGAARVLVALGTLLVLAMAGDELAGHARESDTYALLLFSAAGACLLAGASDLMLLAVAFLLTSIPLYGLIGVVRRPGSAEAALKAYLLGALFGIVLLTGVTVLYGVIGETTYARVHTGLAAAPSAVVSVGAAAVVLGLMFEAGAVPGHFWVPDAAQGSSGTAAAFLTTVPKVGAVVATYRLLTALPDHGAFLWLVAVLAAASMTLGNLAAYFQTDPRRLLGWSTVSQAGYALVPVAVAGGSPLALPSLLIFLAGYVATNLGAFAVVAAFPQRRHLDSYRGLSGSRPWLSAALLVLLLGLVGTPPTAIFVGKLTTGTAAWDGGQPWLTVVLLVNTLASLYYYLRWIVPAYRPGEGIERTATRAFLPLPWATSTAVTAAALSVLVGVGAGLLWPVLSRV